jgi:hypothetical protein
MNNSTGSRGSHEFTALYYSQSNLDNTYSQVCTEINKRTNKDISANANFKTSFNQMAKMVLDKVPDDNRNLSNINNKLIERSVSFFHKKIFEKNMNNDASNSSKGATGFTMAPENKDVENTYKTLMETRELPNLGLGSGIRDNGNPNNYLPQPSQRSSSYVNKEVFTRGAQADQPYVQPSFNRAVDTMTQNKSSPVNKQSQGTFNIKPFDITNELTESLFATENEDTPLYQNIATLQAMENSDPMTLLNDYQKQRNAQLDNYTNTQDRQTITAMRTPGVNDQNIMFTRNNTDANTKFDQVALDPTSLIKKSSQLVNNYAQRMEERIVNDNQIQTLPSATVEEHQRELIKLQRDTQPKYIEKVNYINVNSLDRQWETSPENRFNFQVRFNQDSTYTGAGISQLFKNIISVELVNAILPFDDNIQPFDTRLYLGITKNPYLLLRIDELDGVFRGTNNHTDRAFATLLYDKTFCTHVLPSDYISGSNSIVNSVPTTTFTPEYSRGYHRYNPAYFEKKRFYNMPLASLNKMTITITDPRGQYFNTQSDVLNINTIVYTGVVSGLSGLALKVSNSFPNDADGANRKMIRINTTTCFSNRLFRIGDCIMIANFAMNNNTSNNAAFATYINRDQGHIIINLDLEQTTVGANQGFTSNIYISPPGSLNSTNCALDADTYYDNNTVGVPGEIIAGSAGVLINADLQSQLLFRIVTREADTALELKPMNVW